MEEHIESEYERHGGMICSLYIFVLHYDYVMTMELWMELWVALFNNQTLLGICM